MKNDIDSKINDFKEKITEIYSEINLPNLLNKIADNIKKHLDCEQASIFLYNPKKEELYFEIVTGPKEKELKKIVLKKGEGIAGWVASEDKGVIVNNCSSDPRFTNIPDAKTKFKTKAIAAVPVRINKKLLGVLEAINKKSKVFDLKDKKLLEYISRFVAIPLQNALLFKEITIEIKTKEELFKMGKKILHSIKREEVFNHLKNIISELVDPKDISITVNSEKMIYRLLSNKKEKLTKKSKQKNVYKRDKEAYFPLEIKEKKFGSLFVSTNKPVKEETWYLIEGLTAFVSILLEKSDLLREMIEKKKLEKELEIAREIQLSLFPQKKIIDDRLDFSLINIPSSRMGGDYYHFKKISENQFLFSINDIAGHGIPASLLMAIYSTNLRFCLKKELNLSKTLNYLNNFISETTEPNLYVTSFTCIFDLENKIVKYINAGHVPPFIIRQDEIIFLRKGETCVGLFPFTLYSEANLKIKENDIFAFYTDGIIEAEDSSETQYSTERLIKNIKSNKNLDANSIKNKLLFDLKKFINRTYFDDDITLLILKINNL